MTRRFVILTVIPLAIMFFVAGWLSYAWLLDYVSRDIALPVVVTSVQDAFNHRLLMSLSFALVGAMIGFGALLAARFSKSGSYRRYFFGLFILALLTASGWTFVLVNRMAGLGSRLADTESIFPTALSLDSVPLYEIGLFSVGTLLFVSVILAFVCRE